MQPVTINVAEAAQYLGVGKNRVYELLHESKLPFIRLGKNYRIPKKALDEWLENEVKKSFKF